MREHLSVTKREENIKGLLQGYTNLKVGGNFVLFLEDRSSRTSV